MACKSNSATASEFVVAEADRAWWWRGRDEIVIDRDLVDWSGRGLNALGGQTPVEAGKILASEKLELAADG